MSWSTIDGLHAAAWIAVYSTAIAAFILSSLLARGEGDGPVRTLAFREGIAVVAISALYFAVALGLPKALPPLAMNVVSSSLNGALLLLLALIASALPPFAASVAGGTVPVGGMRARIAYGAFASVSGFSFGLISFFAQNRPDSGTLRFFGLMPLAFVTLALTVAVIRSVNAVFFSRAERKVRWPAQIAFCSVALACYALFIVVELAPQFYLQMSAMRHTTYFFLAGFFLTLNAGISVYLSPRIARPLAHGAHAGALATAGDGSAAFDGVARVDMGLSPREAEVAELLASGASYKEIADRLFVSVSTIQTHVTRIYAKIGARNKVELANRLRKNDIV